MKQPTLTACMKVRTQPTHGLILFTERAQLIHFSKCENMTSAVNLVTKHLRSFMSEVFC